MKVYVVSADIYGGRYGAEIYIYGVFATKEKALKFLEDSHIYGDVTEMELDKLNPTYLGGYIE